MDDAGLQARLQQLPAVDKVVGLIKEEAPPTAVTSAARRAIDSARESVRSGNSAPGVNEIVETARQILRDRQRTHLTPVINATGVLVHTNLGRAPLGQEQLEATRRVSSSYSNLEYDLLSGERGSRYVHAAPLIAEATGGEDALVVNNNAAAVLLVLAGLCRGREVIISRGELIEIGGEFRLPDVMEISGAELIEVGTTNRTHLADYEKAITERTAAILKVHPSNYRVVGFTAGVEASELARLARGRGVPFVHDLGSGLLGHIGEWTKEEPLVTQALEDGADLVTFSGDKLLGGPQTGLIVGRRELIAKLRSEPLIRALRVDKMTLAALEATLTAYLEGREDEIPLRLMALVPIERLRARATRIAEAVDSRDSVAVRPTDSLAGGGSLPGTALPSWAVAVASTNKSASEIERALRAHDPPVIARIENDEVLLDLRTVYEQDDELLANALRSVVG